MDQILFKKAKIFLAKLAKGAKKIKNKACLCLLKPKKIFDSRFPLRPLRPLRETPFAFILYFRLFGAGRPAR
ncbi:MAG: hypothetical protein A2X58_08760 [Nitrospirae bacterium GWC2_56_14]|nr:MAG: hypothetical protein A2X58_08760 [Nitrospirae bacterium GWC2_56_14]